MKNQPNLSPSQAGARLGSIKTPKKSASSARNVAAHQYKAKPLTDYVCTCGGCPDQDAPDAQPGKTSCPRGNVIYQRRRLEAKKARGSDDG